MYYVCGIYSLGSRSYCERNALGPSQTGVVDVHARQADGVNERAKPKSCTMFIGHEDEPEQKTWKGCYDMIESNCRTGGVYAPAFLSNN